MERHIFKCNITLNWLPIFTLLLKCCAILFNYIRAILNLRFFLKKSCDTLDISLCCHNL